MSQVTSRRVQNPFAAGKGTPKRVNYNDFKYHQRRKHGGLCSPVGIATCVLLLVLCVYSLFPSSLPHNYKYDFMTTKAPVSLPVPASVPITIPVSTPAKMNPPVPVPVPVPFPIPAPVPVPHPVLPHPKDESTKEEKKLITYDSEENENENDKGGGDREIPSEEETEDIVDSRDDLEERNIHPSDKNPTHSSNHDQGQGTYADEMLLEPHQPLPTPQKSLGGEENDANDTTEITSKTEPATESPLQKSDSAILLHESKTLENVTNSSMIIESRNEMVKGLDLIKVDTETNNTELISRITDQQGTDTHNAMSESVTNSSSGGLVGVNHIDNSTEIRPKESNHSVIVPDLVTVNTTESTADTLNHQASLDNQTKDENEILKPNRLIKTDNISNETITVGSHTPNNVETNSTLVNESSLLQNISSTSDPVLNETVASNTSHESMPLETSVPKQEGTTEESTHDTQKRKVMNIKNTTTYDSSVPTSLNQTVANPKSNKMKAPKANATTPIVLDSNETMASRSLITANVTVNSTGAESETRKSLNVSSTIDVHSMVDHSAKRSTNSSAYSRRPEVGVNVTSSDMWHVAKINMTKVLRDEERPLGNTTIVSVFANETEANEKGNLRAKGNKATPAL